MFDHELRIIVKKDVGQVEERIGVDGQRDQIPGVEGRVVDAPQRVRDSSLSSDVTGCRRLSRLILSIFQTT